MKKLNILDKDAYVKEPYNESKLQKLNQLHNNLIQSKQDILNILQA